MLNNATGILEKLAKSIARILLVAGLASGTSSRGVGAVTVLDDDDFSGMREHCIKEPNDAIQQSDGFPWWMILDSSRKLASASWSLLALASIGGLLKDIT